MNTASSQRLLVAKAEHDASAVRRISPGFWFAAIIQATTALPSPSCDGGVAATFIE
jgi:hypothetical protein